MGNSGKTHKRSSSALPKTALNKSIAILERAGYKITRRKRTSDRKVGRTRQTAGDKDSQYMVYALKEHEAGAKPYPHEFPSMDEAARACISLSEEGYKILGVRLPGGNYVKGSQIQWSIGLGAGNVKIALGVI